MTRRGGQLGCSDRAHEAAGVRSGSRAGRRFRRLPRVVPEHRQSPSVRSRSRSSSSPWSWWAGWARSGASSSARSSCRRSTTICCKGPRRPRQCGLDFDLSAISSGIYGFLLVIVMLLRPEGLLPERRHRMAFAASRSPVDGGQLTSVPSCRTARAKPAVGLALACERPQERVQAGGLARTAGDRAGSARRRPAARRPGSRARRTRPDRSAP